VSVVREFTEAFLDHDSVVILRELGNWVSSAWHRGYLIPFAIHVRT